MVHNSDKTLLYGIIALLAYRGGTPPRGVPKQKMTKIVKKVEKTVFLKTRDRAPDIRCEFISAPPLFFSLLVIG